MKSPQREVLQRAARYTAMATQIPASAVAGYFLGYLLDQWQGTTWIRVAGLFVGIIGAFAQLIRQILSDQASK